MKRVASAKWEGRLKDGNGQISTQSGVLSNAAYGFSTRFKNEPGTNPEELIAAAHAGCFTMALSAELDKKDLKADEIQTTATVTLEQTGDVFSIPSIHLQVVATIPEAKEDDFLAAAQSAKKGCPVSKLLTATITMDAKLKS